MTEPMGKKRITQLLTQLKRRYGSHRACRQAAKRQGITFSKTPTWQQLEIAFGYLEACQQQLRSYLQN